MERVFLSTLSLRRATPADGQERGGAAHFYPRSPCGERLWAARLDGTNTAHFYPRSPCGERQNGKSWISSPKIFLSTLSLRRATGQYQTPSHRHYHFYPRSPCGERQQKSGDRKAYVDFYPRSPCGERRWSVDVPGWILGISIHALLAESDGPRFIRYRVGIAISIHALLAESDAIAAYPVFPMRVFLSTLSLRRATAKKRRSESPR